MRGGLRGGWHAAAAAHAQPCWAWRTLMMHGTCCCHMRARSHAQSRCRCRGFALSESCSAPGAPGASVPLLGLRPRLPALSSTECTTPALQTLTSPTDTAAARTDAAAGGAQPAGCSGRRRRGLPGGCICARPAGHDLPRAHQARTKNRRSGFPRGLSRVRGARMSSRDSIPRSGQSMRLPRCCCCLGCDSRLCP